MEGGRYVLLLPCSVVDLHKINVLWKTYSNSYVTALCGFRMFG